MKVHYIGVIRTEKPVHELCAEKELSEYSRFTRNSYGEFMTMFAKLVAERTKPGVRQTVPEQDYAFHAYARSEGICPIIITSHDYPKGAAHQILGQVADDFLAQNPRSSWATGQPKIAVPELAKLLATAQDPKEVNQILRIQKDLDETLIVMRKNVQSVMERGESLDNLVEKSSELSAQTKMFAVQARKQNSCCVLM